MKRSANTSQNGGIIVFVALVTVLMIQFIALAIDVARMYIINLQKEANTEYGSQVALHEFIMQRDVDNSSFKVAYSESLDIALSGIDNRYLGGGSSWADVPILTFGFWDGSKFNLLKSDDYTSVNSARLHFATTNFDYAQSFYSDVYFARVMGSEKVAWDSLVVSYIDPSRAAANKNPIMITSG